MYPDVDIFARFLERRQLRDLLRHLCGVGFHRTRLVGQLETMGCATSCERSSTLRIGAFLGLSHLLNSMVGLGLSYLGRYFLQDLSNRMIRVGHASVSRILRYCMYRYIRRKPSLRRHVGVGGTSWGYTIVPGENWDEIEQIKECVGLGT